MMKHKITALITAMLLLISATGCSLLVEENSQSVPKLSSAISATESSSEEIPIENLANTSGQASTQILLNSSDAAITGTGAELNGSTLSITSGGTYTLIGSFTGSIVIAAPATAKVQLILDGATIAADKNAAIYCSQADQLTITLAAGSTNTVTDTKNLTYTDTAAEEPDAAIFSKTDLTVNGTGSLKVTANYNNGIGTKDNLVIESGTIEVTASNHGLRGRDSLTVIDGDITIASLADGIQSNNDEDVSKGWISLEGGTYHITAGNDAIQAETALTISAGTYTLSTGGGSTATSLDAASSYKGLKAGTNMLVSGGSLTINSGDDTVHANGNIEISGGTFSLSSGDDGVHADGDLTIGGTDTKIDILTSYEGLEASTMTIGDGTVAMNATDDGINVAGGNDVTTNGAFGTDSFSGGNSNRWLLISGGTITVNAGSDAIDINGSGKMTGGTVTLAAGLLGEGQTLDVDGTWESTGGELTETGGSGGGRGGR